MRGKDLTNKWKVDVKHGLYRESGDWYHQLKDFPGAFFDKNGYIIFNSERDYKNNPYLRIQKNVHVKKGISSIPGYVSIADGEEKVSLAEKEKDNLFYEGNVKQVKLNKYERNTKARKACLMHFGTKCSVCNKDMGDIYGDVAKGIIHVHHLLPLSLIGKEYIINPIEDLQPVCPNCHAVIHKKNPAYTIDEVKAMLTNK